jgi:hypothetical protein
MIFEMRKIVFLAIATLQLLGAEQTMAQTFMQRPPLYIVNGVRVSQQQISAIDPEDIVSEELLPADEASVTKYGQEVSNGVIIISLRYDTPARFEPEGRVVNPADYVAERIKWDWPANPVARVVLRLRISPAGVATIAEVIDSTDKRFLKKVQKVLAQMPRWVAARKDGEDIEDDYTLRLTMPRGMQPAQRQSVPIIVGGA